MKHTKSIEELQNQIIACRTCPRLVKWCSQVARERKAAYANYDYWGKPVPSFGDSHARLIIVGLAPGAHGANRTGRMFTGDRSGLWLYRALHRARFSDREASTDSNDGLVLTDAFISAVVHCAPPANKPTPEERDACLPYLVEELQILTSTRVILALGSFAWDGVLRALSQLDYKASPRPKFSHGAEVELGPYTLLGSFHPSQQNTFTRRLTEPMFDGIFSRCHKLLKDCVRVATP